MKKFVSVLVLALIPVLGFASGGEMHLDKFKPNLDDKASLQRGVKLFTNYCMGCHSAEYMRYKRVAQDLEIPEELYVENLIFTGAKIGELMQIPLPQEQAANWFGKAPPDLTLEARLRGPDWIYSYLRGFYEDESRPFGVNNVVFPNVGMPHVLVGLQGLCAEEPHIGAEPRMEPLSGTVEGGELCTDWAVEGSMDQQEYDQAVYDITNFLEYLGEPVLLKRKHIGLMVLIFIAIFFVFAYMLNREYWKDVH
ncbi:cytochrome c1 [Marinobacteraceae bacterium S3BR75-40.1]